LSTDTQFEEVYTVTPQGALAAQEASKRALVSLAQRRLDELEHTLMRAFFVDRYEEVGPLFEKLRGEPHVLSLAPLRFEREFIVRRLKMLTEGGT
jgi:hypothetical protein